MTILDEANEAVNGPRQDSYGHPSEHFEHVAAMWNALLGYKLAFPIAARDVPHMMIAMKLIREAKKHKRDNLVDIAGFARTAETMEDTLDAVADVARLEMDHPEAAPDLPVVPWPTTADGQPVKSGMTLYVKWTHIDGCEEKTLNGIEAVDGEQWFSIRDQAGSVYSVKPTICYSTREAAEAEPDLPVVPWPTTADGQPAKSGMPLFVRWPHRLMEEMECRGIHGMDPPWFELRSSCGDLYVLSPGICYSTREAAEAEDAE